MTDQQDQQIVPLTKETIGNAQTTIEKVVSACNIVTLSQLGALEQAITLARGISALKRVFSQQLVEEIFMPLQGSSLGFLTDKDKEGGYAPIVVRNCWIQGCIWGLQPTNNELNIIAEKPYAAKNGLERKVRESVRCLVVRPGVPVASGDKTALLPMRASWIFDGKRHELVKDLTKVDDAMFDERYAIRVNAGMGPDAIIGKGYRKMYRDILGIIANGFSVISDGDVTDVAGVEIKETGPIAPPDKDDKRLRLGKKPAPAPEPNPEDDGRE